MLFKIFKRKKKEVREKTIAEKLSEYADKQNERFAMLNREQAEDDIKSQYSKILNDLRDRAQQGEKYVYAIIEKQEVIEMLKENGFVIGRKGEEWVVENYNPIEYKVSCSHD